MKREEKKKKDQYIKKSSDSDLIELRFDLNYIFFKKKSSGVLPGSHPETPLQSSPPTLARGAQAFPDSRPSMNGNGSISPAPLQPAAPRKPLELILSLKRSPNSNSPNSNNSNSSNNSTEIEAASTKEKDHKQRKRSSRGSAQEQ